MRKFTSDDTEHGKEYYLASDVDALMAQPEQEPVAWADKQSLDQIENFDATIYAKGGFDNATPLYITPPLPVQPDERNFCQRCGKRTADLTTIHTCTPPPREW